MVGVITEANPNGSFRISHHHTKGHFCESAGGFAFNLDHVREDEERLRGMPWREVATAIYRYDDYRHATDEQRERTAAALEKAFKKLPAIQSVLPKIKARPGSGEMELLRLLLSDTRV